MATDKRSHHSIHQLRREVILLVISDFRRVLSVCNFNTDDRGVLRQALLRTLQRGALLLSYMRANTQDGALLPRPPRILVRDAGFEPATTWFQTTDANQTTPIPEIYGANCESRTRLRLLGRQGHRRYTKFA